MKNKGLGLMVFVAAAAMVMLAECFVAAHFHVPVLLAYMVAQCAAIGVIIGHVCNTIDKAEGH